MITSEAKDNGRKRHIATDTLGLLLVLLVTAASVQDTTGGRDLVMRAGRPPPGCGQGLGGQRLHSAASPDAVPPHAITVEVVGRTSPHTFQVLPRRWVVERTFAWITRYRRPVRDYERRTDHTEAMIYWAMIILMTRRLARYETGQPPGQRWGGERKRPGRPELEQAKQAA